MAVSIRTESAFEPDVPRRLFLAPVRGHAVAPDGQRFLLNVSLDMDAERRVRDMPPIHILANWPAGLTK